MAKYTQDATPRGANKIVSSLSANLLLLFFGEPTLGTVLRMSFGDIIGKWLMDKLLLLLIFVSLFPGKESFEDQLLFIIILLRFLCRFRKMGGGGR